VQADIANVETADWVAGGAALLLLIALFLPWTRVSGSGNSLTFGASFGWISILSVLVVLTIFGVTVLDVELPFPSGLAYLGAGGLSVLFTLLVMLIRPASVLGFGIPSGPGVSKMPWFGAFIAFIAAVVILVAGYLKYKEQRY
jgi:hypothetical protein